MEEAPEKERKAGGAKMNTTDTLRDAPGLPPGNLSANHRGEEVTHDATAGTKVSIDRLNRKTSKGTMVKPQPSICSCQRCLLIQKWKVLL